MLIRRTDAAAMVGRSLSGFDKLVAADSTFPRPIKMGATRQAPVYFDEAEIVAWIEAQKAMRQASAAEVA